MPNIWIPFPFCECLVYTLRSGFHPSNSIPGLCTPRRSFILEVKRKMSTNPQWNSSLYSPKSPAPSSLLGFGYNGGSNSSSNILSSSGAAVNGFNNFPSFGRSNSSSGTFFPSQTNSATSQFSINNSQSGSVSPPLGSSSIGHFPIGTFNANSAFSEESIKTPAAVHLGNGNVHRDGGSSSPNNLGSRETGIIEKLLVSFLQCNNCNRIDDNVFPP